MKCPICNGGDLAVEVTFRGMVSCRFHNGDQFDLLQPPHFQSGWDDSSRVACLSCAWNGTVLDATREVPRRAAAASGPRRSRSTGRRQAAGGTVAE
ncbi:MAG TPA: hypothetical protein VML55_05560 [Planctomycetaceae bacterium]|nr:hypothetical protein [Planctomycetaceae bacterium]